MTEIPEDVMKAAIEAYERPIVEDGSSLVSLVNRMVEDEIKLCIARAILAERERCCLVLRRLHEQQDGETFVSIFIDIEEIIRKGL